MAITAAGARARPAFKRALERGPSAWSLGPLLVLATGAVAVFTLVAWLALAPESGLLAFLSGADAFTSLLAGFSLVAGAWLAVLQRAGAAPGRAWDERVIDWVMGDARVRRGALAITGALVSIGAVLVLLLLQPLTSAQEQLFEGDPAQRVRECGDAVPGAATPLRCLGARARLAFAREGSAAQDADCLALLPLLGERQAAFAPIADRYLANMIAAWCHYALESPREAREHARRAGELARLLQDRDAVRARLLESAILLRTTQPSRLSLRTKEDVVFESFGVLQRMRLGVARDDETRLWRARRLVQEGHGHAQLKDFTAARASWRLAGAALGTPRAGEDPRLAPERAAALALQQTLPR